MGDLWFNLPTLMEDTNSLIEQRKAKLAALRAKGIDPFKNKFSPTETCKQARDNYAEGREVAVAGRITAHREMGKSMFLDVRDQSGRLQIYAQKNHLEETAPGSWDTFTHLDLGDFIGARGKLFTTKTGEISIKLDSFVILAKALRPPPAKWHGLEDTEIRYRQRYLDLMANSEVKDIFLKRSEIIREIRNFLHSRGFVEVETPMMQAIPGGAAAQPFKTHHNALGCDFYLRIALELYLKRLLVGGVDKVFEIGRNFRNEGLSRKHNPEFTMLEAYQAFGDYESMMELVESMTKHVAQKVLGTLKIEHEQRDSFILALENAVKRLENSYAELHKLEIQSSHKLHIEGLRKAHQTLVELRSRAASEPIIKLAEEAIQAARSFIVVFEEVPDAQGNVPPWPENNQALNNCSYSQAWIKQTMLQFTTSKAIDLTPPWRRVKYKDLIRERIDSGWFEMSPKERLVYAEQLLGVEVGGRPRRKLAETAGKWLPFAERIRSYIDQGLQINAKLSKDDKRQFDEMLDELSQRAEYLKMGVEDFEVTGAVFEKLIEPTLIQPTFVTHLPKELVPLAKLSPDDPRSLRVLHQRPGNRARLHRAERSHRAARTARTSGRRRAAEAGRGFSGRARTRHAARRRHGHGH
jgi:lysyl-tRNA synthetase